MPHFFSPWFALLLLPLLGAFYWSLRRRPPSLLVSHAGTYGAGKSRSLWRPVHAPLLIQTLGLALLVVALMRPQEGLEKVMQHAEGIDIMLLLDVSGSMEAFDPSAGLGMDEAARQIQSGLLKNRLEVAKQELAKFVQRRPGDRIGLIAFATRPYVVCPPTLDHDFLLNHLQTLQPGMFADNGTGIAPPIASATSRLKDSQAKRRVAVLFTDGENNVEAKITPVEAAGIAAQFAVSVYTVGIGGRQAVAIRSGWFGRRQLVQAGYGLDQELLEKIAAETGGKYFAARDAAMFGQVMEEIDQLETIGMEVPRFMDYREQFYSWMLTGAGLFLLGLFLEYTIFLRGP